MSKTISTAGGWAVLLAGPAILADPPLIPRTMAGLSLTAVIAGAIFLNVLARTMIMDLQEVFGDRLFGRKTMASLLGRAKAIRLLAAVLVIWALYLLAALALGGPPTILWLCLTGPLYNAAILMRRWRDLGLMGFQLDLILDAQFVLSGLGYWIL
jgi:4-hydroxybenzoate polyprenyltransferase